MSAFLALTRSGIAIVLAMLAPAMHSPRTTIWHKPARSISRSFSSIARVAIRRYSRSEEGVGDRGGRRSGSSTPMSPRAYMGWPGCNGSLLHCDCISFLRQTQIEAENSRTEQAAK
jgi:hypothetical protein